jgi:hypothetical protein
MVSNMFFHISAFNVVLVTQRIVYPFFSKEDEAVAIAVQVLPVPTE